MSSSKEQAMHSNYERRSKDEITIMKTVGFATLDIVAAAEVAKKAAEAGAGTVINL